jgi:hypothetical protein
VFGEKERESGGGDFRRRMMMFESMIESILMTRQRSRNRRNKKR